MNICMATETISVATGGVRCIVEQLNGLGSMGHNVCCFTEWGRNSAFDSSFPIYPIKDLYGYDGVVICPWSPVAQYVSDGPQKEKFYYVHIYEPLFPRPKEWRAMSFRSYNLPLKLFSTSYYIHMFLEFNHRRKVIRQLVPGGFDPKLFFPNLSLRQKDIINIGIMNRTGRYDKFRGCTDAITAMEKIKKDYSDKVNIVLFGNIENIPKCPYQYDIITTKTQQELIKAYQSVDIFINASYHEGWPLPVCEAAACQCAILTTRWGTSDSWFNGVNCLTIDTRCPEDIYLKTKFLIDNPEKRELISVNAVRTAVENYTWEHSVNRLLNVINIGLGDNSYITEKVDLGYPDDKID